MSVLMNPDCLDGKHRSCSGDGWCEVTEQLAPCPCDCHQPKECYPDCPCGKCQQIRAAKPEPPVPLAYLGCCGATIQLQRIPGGYAGTETHHTHCPDTGATFLPKTKEDS